MTASPSRLAALEALDRLLEPTYVEKPPLEHTLFCGHCLACMTWIHPAPPLEDWDPGTPPFQLRCMAELYEEVEWLAYLSPQERRQYAAHRSALELRFPRVPEDVWEALLR